MLVAVLLALAAASPAALNSKLCGTGSEPACGVGSFCNFQASRTSTGAAAGQCVGCSSCAECSGCGLPPPGAAACSASCPVGNLTKPYNISFRAPVAVGTSTSFTAAEFSASTGDGKLLVSLGLSKIAVSTDGGASYSHMDVGRQTSINVSTEFNGVELLPTASGAFPGLKFDYTKLHDLGSQSASFEADSSNKSFSSNVTWGWAWAADGKSVTVTATELKAPIVFEGLPEPAFRLCSSATPCPGRGGWSPSAQCPSGGGSCHARTACPCPEGCTHADGSSAGSGLRFQGSSHVIFGDGSIVQTAVVAMGGNPDLPCALSSVAFISRDGGTRFTFQGTIAAAGDNKWSEEGPGGEHDCVLIDFGQIFCVLRTDGGDGTTGQRLPFYWTTSKDAGVTWSPLAVLNGTGSARPRLLQLGDGFGPLILSGGRMHDAANNISQTFDSNLWVNFAGIKGYPPSRPLPPWEMWAVSFLHNSLTPASEHKFTKQVNETSGPGYPGYVGFAETSSYTSLQPVGKCSFVLFYMLRPNRHYCGVYSMRVDLHVNEGGETGLHC
jgi:hypothetical protein